MRMTARSVRRGSQLLSCKPTAIVHENCIEVFVYLTCEFVFNLSRPTLRHEEARTAELIFHFRLVQHLVMDRSDQINWAALNCGDLDCFRLIALHAQILRRSVASFLVRIQAVGSVAHTSNDRRNHNPSNEECGSSTLEGSQLGCASLHIAAPLHCSIQTATCFYNPLRSLQHLLTRVPRNLNSL